MVVVINKPASSDRPLTLSSSAENGETLTITFDRGLAADAGSVPAAGDFAVRVGGRPGGPGAGGGQLQLGDADPRRGRSGVRGRDGLPDLW